MASALVVNADDLGVSKGATLGIIKAHREGIVTSASIAVTTPFYDHAVKSCVQTCPDLGMGLHFTLTSGKPVSEPARVPLLVGRNGFFRWRFISLLRAAAIEKKKELLDQVVIELNAQLGRLIADGIKPDHIDGERHVHLIPGIFEKVVAAAWSHGVPFVRAGTDVGSRCVRGAHVPGLIVRGGFAKSWLLSRLSARDRTHLRDGVSSADRVASYLYTGRIDLMIKCLLGVSPVEGVTELMVHPGIPEESRGIDLGNKELERYLVSEDRRIELNACVEARSWLERWELTTFGRVAAAARLS
ncbi:MAG TPA: ChbG/HpnK family deacetylase [Gemmatimonadaceae bacterium]